MTCSVLLRLRLVDDLVVLVELDADRVDAVSLVGGRGVALAFEDVSKVAPTVGAHNLNPLHAKGTIHVSCHSSRHCVEEGWPSTSTLELLVGRVEGSFAAGAGVDSLVGVVLVVLAAEGRLSALLAEDSKLLYGSDESVLVTTRGTIKVVHGLPTYLDSVVLSTPRHSCSTGKTCSSSSWMFRTKLQGRGSLASIAGRSQKVQLSEVARRRARSSWCTRCGGRWTQRRIA